MFLLAGVITVMTATRSWRIKQMENITIDTATKPTADAHPGATKTKAKKASKGGEAAKKAKPAKKAPRAKKATGKTERSNKKAEVIGMMKRAKGATLAEIVEATGWQKHTVRGFVSILGSKAARRSHPRRTPQGNASTKSPSFFKQPSVQTPLLASSRGGVPPVSRVSAVMTPVIWRVRIHPGVPRNIKKL